MRGLGELVWFYVQDSTYLQQRCSDLSPLVQKVVRRESSVVCGVVRPEADLQGAGGGPVLGRRGEVMAAKAGQESVAVVQLHVVAEAVLGAELQLKGNKIYAERCACPS